MQCLEMTVHLMEAAIETGVLKLFSIPVFQSMVEVTMKQWLSSSALRNIGLDYTEPIEAMMKLILQEITKEED